MKIQVLSDLHNEFVRSSSSENLYKWKGEIEYAGSDLIILAGDIDVGTKGVEWAIEESNRLNVPIVYVIGNHEYYHHEMTQLEAAFIEITKNTDVTVLNPGCVVFGNIRIIGATLWTDYNVYPICSQNQNMQSVSTALNDHRLITIKENNHIRYFKPEDALLLHKKHLNWIKKTLEVPFSGKTVVVTHHGPHQLCQHKSYSLGSISTGFHSDLSYMFDDYEIDAWIYGHTHSNLDVQVGNTRLISNQAGYPGERIIDFNLKFSLNP